MAGDWIKIRTELSTSPKLVRISSALKADRLTTLGCIVSALCLADMHAESENNEGLLDGYTPEVFDSLVGMEGITHALESVGWVRVEASALVFTDFELHNGKSAKRRCQDQKRKIDVRKTSASKADKKRTREEKRREEKRTTKVDAVPYQKIVDLYHENLPLMPAVRMITDSRKKSIKVRWGEKDFKGNPMNDIGWWDRYFKYASSLPFLHGANDRNWSADLDWIINQTNLAKIIEGKYEHN